MALEGEGGVDEQIERSHRPTNDFVSTKCSILRGATGKDILIQRVGLEEESDYDWLKTIEKEKKMPGFG